MVGPTGSNSRRIARHWLFLIEPYQTSFGVCSANVRFNSFY